MYIRFEGLRQNERSSSRLGVLQLAFELRDSGTLPRYSEETLLNNISWIKEHLHSPRILREEGRHRAISWFHPRANEPLKRVREIVAILEDAGYHMNQVQTRDPGEIIYEDGWQLVATPRKR